MGYEDPDGQIHRIVAVPAERYIGNEDARGGFGALQYPDVLGQVYDRLAATGGLDPAHPPFFLLHSTVTIMAAAPTVITSTIPAG